MDGRMEVSSSRDRGIEVSSSSVGFTSTETIRLAMDNRMEVSPSYFMVLYVHRNPKAY